MQRKDLKSPFSLFLEILRFRKNCLFDSLKSSKTYKCKSLQTFYPYLKYPFCNCVLISLRANKICCSTVRFETDSSRAISEGVRFSKKDRQYALRRFSGRANTKRSNISFNSLKDTFSSVVSCKASCV